MSQPPRHLHLARIRHTLSTLIFASVVCLLLWAMRAYVAHGFRFFGFVWNLFLAWVPLYLALMLRRWSESGWTLRIWLMAVLWFLFFPNAFYIVTDLIHFTKFGTDGVPRWFDCLMTVAFACGGMFLGCLSLYLMHLAVRARCGWRWGWAFAVFSLALGAVGVHLGRFARLNSWDIIIRPWRLLSEVSDLVDPPESKNVIVFCGAFFIFSLSVYLFVVSMSRLHEEERTP